MSKDKRQSRSRSRSREGKQSSFLHQLKQSTRRRHKKKTEESREIPREEEEEAPSGALAAANNDHDESISDRGLVESHNDIEQLCNKAPSSDDAESKAKKQVKSAPHTAPERSIETDIDTVTDSVSKEQRQGAPSATIKDNEKKNNKKQMPDQSIISSDASSTKNRQLQNENSCSKFQAKMEELKEQNEKLVADNDRLRKTLSERFKQQQRDNQTIHKLNEEKEQMEKENKQTIHKLKEEKAQVEKANNQTIHKLKEEKEQMEKEKESWAKKYWALQHCLRQVMKQADTIDQAENPSSLVISSVLPQHGTEEDAPDNDMTCDDIPASPPCLANKIQTKSNQNNEPLDDIEPERLGGNQQTAISRLTEHDQSTPLSGRNLNESDFDRGAGRTVAKVNTSVDPSMPNLNTEDDAVNVDVTKSPTGLERCNGMHHEKTHFGATNESQIEQEQSTDYGGETVKESTTIAKEDCSDTSGTFGTIDNDVRIMETSKPLPNDLPTKAETYQYPEAEAVAEQHGGQFGRGDTNTADKRSGKARSRCIPADVDATNACAVPISGIQLGKIEKSSTGTEFTHCKSTKEENKPADSMEGIEVLETDSASYRRQPSDFKRSKDMAKNRAFLDSTASSMSSTSEKIQKTDDLWWDDDEDEDRRSRKSRSAGRPIHSNSGWIKIKAKTRQKTQTTMTNFVNSDTSSKAKPTRGRSSQSIKSKDSPCEDEAFVLDDSPVKRRRSPSPTSKVASDKRSRSMIHRKKQRLGSDSDGIACDATRNVDKMSSQGNSVNCPPSDSHFQTDTSRVHSPSEYSGVENTVDSPLYPSDQSHDAAASTKKLVTIDSQSPLNSCDRQPNRVSLSASKMSSVSTLRKDPPSARPGSELEATIEKNLCTYSPVAWQKDSLCDKTRTIPLPSSPVNEHKDTSMGGNDQNETQQGGPEFERTIPTSEDALTTLGSQSSITQWEMPAPRGIPNKELSPYGDSTRYDPLVKSKNFRAKVTRQKHSNALTSENVFQEPPCDGVAVDHNTQGSETQWEPCSRTLDSAPVSSGAVNHDTQGSETQWEPRSAREKSQVKFTLNKDTVNHDSQGSETQWEPRSAREKSQVKFTLNKDTAIDSQSSETQLPREVIAGCGAASPPEKDNASGDHDRQASDTRWEPSLNHLESSSPISKGKENIPTELNQCPTRSYFANIQKTTKPNILLKPNSNKGWISNKSSRTFLSELDRACEAKHLSSFVPGKPERQLVTRSKNSAKSDSCGYDEFMERNDDDSDPGYAYVESRRNKCRMPKAGEDCFDCDNCRAFYAALQQQGIEIDPSVFAKNNALKNSRHRGRSKRTDTPDEFWEMSFADSIQRRMQGDERMLPDADETSDADFDEAVEACTKTRPEHEYFFEDDEAPGGNHGIETQV